MRADTFQTALTLQWISQNPDAHLNTIRIKFENLLASFIRLRVPTIAAICGHAAAGVSYWPGTRLQVHERR
jgi:hypothetical protein